MEREEPDEPFRMASEVVAVDGPTAVVRVDVHYGDGGHFVSGDRGVSEWTLTGTTTEGVRLNVRGCDDSVVASSWRLGAAD